MTNDYCSQHIVLSTDIASIKTSVANIEKQLVQGVNFKTAVVGSLIGMMILVIVQIVALSYFLGQMSNQIKVNTARLEVIEKK